MSRRTLPDKHCAQCGAVIPRGSNYAKAKFCNDQCHRASRYGREAQIALFWTRVNKTEGCWLWTGWVLNSGYGEHGRTHRSLAHRFSYALVYGEIPKGQLVLHKCDTPLCVRPDHLFLGTDADNARDKAAKGRALRGERIWTAVLTADDVRAIRPLKGKVSSYELAKQYGVTDGAITKIWRGDTWAHVL